jgi:defect-in-organelle-trafficking protein DotC
MRVTRISILLFFLCGLTACANNCAVQPIQSRNCDPCKSGINNVEDLKRLCACSNGNCNSVCGLRFQAIQESAMSVGAQAGLAARAKVINCELEKNAKYLDQAFNFQLLMLPCSVLPPILGEGRHTLNLADDCTIRLADRTYVILQQAKFVTAPPHWREYLFLDYKEPDINETTCAFAKTCDERKLWNKYLIEGWNDGIGQANSIAADNLARLKRDYSGMIRYRTLLAQKMVSIPFVSKTNLGITCDSCGMRINDQVLRITALPQICTDSKTWRPAITHERTICPAQ